MFIAIGIGSNTAGATRHVAEALQWIAARFQSVRLSAPYRTAGVGKKSQGQTYCNAVAVGHSDLAAEELNRLLKEYESAHGRVKGSPQVTIDLDLVIYGDTVLRPGDFGREYFQRGYRQVINT